MDRLEIQTSVLKAARSGQRPRLINPTFAVASASITDTLTLLQSPATRLESVSDCILLSFSQYIVILTQVPVLSITVAVGDHKVKPPGGP